MADNTSAIENTIQGQILQLIAIKQDIAQAIVDCGGSVSTSDTFASYADKIRDLNKMEASLGTLNVSEDGTYKASDEGYDGYSSVTVNVGGGGDEGGGGGGGGEGGGGGDSGDYDDGVDDKPNTYKVTFYAEDKTTVLDEQEVEFGDAATFAGDETALDKEGYKFSRWDPIPSNVQADMSCYPIYTSLNAEIEDSWDEIVANGGANYNIGQYKILRFGKIDDVFYGYKDDNGQNGAKIIPPGGGQYLTGTMWNASVKMVKVANGEDGSTSTWLAEGAIQGRIGSTLGQTLSIPYIKDDDVLYQHWGYGYSAWTGSFWGWGGTLEESEQRICNYEKSTIHKFLNSSNFLSALPKALQNGIVEVSKPVACYTDAGLFENKNTVNAKVWIPSWAEMNGNSASDAEYEYTHYEAVQAFGAYRTADSNNQNQYRTVGNPAVFAVSAGIQIGFCI